MGSALLAWRAVGLGRPATAVQAVRQLQSDQILALLGTADSNCGDGLWRTAHRHPSKDPSPG